MKQIRTTYLVLLQIIDGYKESNSKVIRITGKRYEYTSIYWRFGRRNSQKSWQTKYKDRGEYATNNIWQERKCIQKEIFYNELYSSDSLTSSISVATRTKTKTEFNFTNEVNTLCVAIVEFWFFLENCKTKNIGFFVLLPLLKAVQDLEKYWMNIQRQTICAAFHYEFGKYFIWMYLLYLII